VSVAIFQQCVDADALRATAALPTVPVYNRRKPHLIDGDKIPCVVVSHAPEGERVLFEAFGGVIVYGYPVTVMCVSAGNELYTLRYPADPDEEADRETMGHTEMREVLREAMYKMTLTDVDSVFNCDPPAMGPAFRVMASNQSLYLVAMMTVTHWSLETKVW